MPIANEDGDSQEAMLEAAAHRDYLQARADMGGDSEFTELIEVITTECPHISSHEAQDILDCLKDRGVFRRSRSGPAASGMEVISKFKEICQDIWTEDPSLKNYARFYALNIPFLDDLYGGMTQTEFAKHLCGKKIGERTIVSITKAAVGKEVKEAAARLRKLGIKLVPRAEQRSPEACARMKQARENQLATNAPHELPPTKTP